MKDQVIIILPYYAIVFISISSIEIVNERGLSSVFVMAKTKKDILCKIQTLISRWFISTRNTIERMGVSPRQL